jgi:nicotinate-nucleotide pyrophosphorylase (carboxylating)
VTLEPDAYLDLVRRALAEDLGTGDITTMATVPPDLVAEASFLARTACVVAGLEIARQVFRELDPDVRFTSHVPDGRRCEAGASIASVRGRAAALLSAERTALNFLQHLTGIATVTRRYVEAATGRIVVLDTRKTIPTLRTLAKYAVRCGGGTNHRFGLHDAVLVKENHARIAGGLAAAIAAVRARWPGRPVEAEAQSLKDVDAALAAGAEVIMLDNLTDVEMRSAIAVIAGRARIEISGGVTIERLPALAALGADWVSVGALTHSAPAADISLDFHAAAT